MRKLHHLMMGILLLIFTGAQAQTKEVTGKVTDLTGLPISNATIKIKGTNSGTSAGTDGEFRLSVKGSPVLIISAVGYESREVSTANTSTVTVQLGQDAKSLSEVVVTGVGVATSKKKLGIAVESVTADKLPAAPTASIDQALVGKIAGAQISSVDGTPGAKTNILLRGINTLQNGTQPLILVNGIQLGATDLSSLDMNNIERVEVVQGAASATIYGAQGANGVIQIFTKKGRPGQLNIDFSSTASTNEYINNGNVHKAIFHSFLTDASNNVIDGNGNIIPLSKYGTYTGVTWAYPAGPWPGAMSNPLNIMNKPYDQNLKYYDHLKQLFQTGYAYTNSLSITGGSAKSDFALAFSNNHQESAIRNNGYVDRTNFTSNLGAELFKGFKLRSITELVYTKNTLHPYYQAGENRIFNALNVNPFYDLNQKMADGNFPRSLTTGTVSVNGANPNYDFQYTSGLDNKVDVFQNIDANYKVNRFVELDGKYGINFKKQDVNWIFKNQSGNLNSTNYKTRASDYNGSDNTGEIDNFTYTTTFQNLLVSAYIRTDFQKDFHSKLPITTSTQLSFDYRKNKYSQYITYGYSLPTYPIYNMNQTASQQVISDYAEPFVTYGYLVNQKIDIGEYGGLSGGFRSDYSSAFGQASAPFTFPRADAYIRPSSFKFWNESKLGDLLPEVKFRAAYGQAGIQPQPFDRYITIKPGNIGSSLAFSLPTTGNNPNLQVEVSKEFEAGTDISVKALKGNWLSSINLAFTYWTRKGTNVIYAVNVAPSTGPDALKTNAIDLSSHGLQASLNLSVLKSRNFNWDFTTNFSRETSQIDKINGPDIILTSAAGSTSLTLTAGQKIGQIYGYKAFRSVTQTKQDGTPYINKADYGNYQLVNGYLVDTATKGMQFTNEKYSFGDPNPKFNASFINTIGYKDFLFFSFQFDWVYGSHLYNQTKEWMYRDGVHGDYDVPVSINGTSAAYTAYYRSIYGDFFGGLNGAARNGTKDFYYEDASFLRLRNVSLGFDVAKFVAIKYVKKLQVVFTGRNIWTVTKYTGFDPEISSGASNSAFDRGVDHSSMPNVKSYQLGLNVGF